MFEKEAEAYVNEEYDFCYYPEDNLSARINAKRDWQKGAEHVYNKMKEENVILRKALRMYIDWADECGVAWDSFPDEKEKWYAAVEEKGLSWIDGLMFMIIQEAKEQLSKEERNA